MTLASPSAMLRFLLLAAALLSFLPAEGRELSPAQREELEELRRRKWDEGCSDEEIQEACDRRREEMRQNLPSRPERPDPRSLDQDFKDLTGALDDIERILPRPRARIVDAAREFMQREWDRAEGLDPAEQERLLKSLRFGCGERVLSAWSRVQLPSLAKELQPFVDAQRSKGVQGEDLLDAVSLRFDKVPEPFFDLFDPEDPFPKPLSFAGRGDEDEEEEEPREDEAPDLTDAEVDLIADELILEILDMMEEGMGR